jgi:acyl-coenzyme A synthetase/AMP-(fatty) acid ligase
MSCRGYVVANGNRRNYDFANCFVTPTKPTYASLPLPGIQPVLMDEKRNEIEGNQVTGSLCIKFLGPELPEPFGAIIKDKDTYSTFQVNISLETALT